jgi:RecB family exonuclease
MPKEIMILFRPLLWKKSQSCPKKKPGMEDKILQSGVAADEVCYSVSQLKMFEQCPLRYRYHYVERARNLIQTIESFVGARVHETLEYLHSRLHEGCLLPISDVVTDYRRRWENKWHRSIRITRASYHRDWYRKYGEKCVRHYYSRHYPFQQDGETTIAIEWSFNISLSEESGYRMKGHVDLLSKQEDDSFIVHDYKTTPIVPRLKRLVRDPQPGVYQLAVQQSFPEARKVTASWHYLATKRELHPTLSARQLNQLKCLLIQKIDQIEETSDFAPRTSPACHSCEYKEQCPAFEEYNAKQCDSTSLAS